MYKVVEFQKNRFASQPLRSCGVCEQERICNLSVRATVDGGEVKHDSSESRRVLLDERAARRLLGHCDFETSTIFDMLLLIRRRSDVSNADHRPTREPKNTQLNYSTSTYYEFRSRCERTKQIFMKAAQSTQQIYYQTFH